MIATFYPRFLGTGSTGRTATQRGDAEVFTAKAVGPGGCSLAAMDGCGCWQVLVVVVGSGGGGRCVAGGRWLLVIVGGGCW